MSESQQVDVLIVGGGMAGGFLACALAATTLSVCVLDAAAVPVVPSGDADLRVVALTEASRNLLVNTGVWKHLDQARLLPYQQMQVFDSDGTGEVNFSAAEVGAEALGWMLENTHLVTALYQRLQAEPQVDWRSDSRVARLEKIATGWQVTLANGETIQCRLLVGADGARSSVREAAGIAVSQRDTGHRALVTSLSTELAHGNCARQWFMSTGPLAFLPLFGDDDGDSKQVSIVWSCVPEKAQQLAALSLDDFGRALTQASEGALGQVRPQAAPVGFPIIEQHASSYVAERLALIGDAAHVIHPLAGQGINLGLLDAGVLAEEIIRAQQQGLDIAAPHLLVRYQRRRRGHNLLMQQSMRAFQMLFAQQPPALRWLRNTGMKLVNGSALARQQLISEALGRHGDLPALAQAQRTNTIEFA